MWGQSEKRPNLISAKGCFRCRVVPFPERARVGHCALPEAPINCGRFAVERGVAGALIMWGRGEIKFGAPEDKTAMSHWQCKLQVPIFDNTPGSEQAALMELGHSIFWFRNMAEDCGIPQRVATGLSEADLSP